MLREIDGPAGRLEALLNAPEPEALKAAVVFGHPHPQHGGTMHTKGAFQSAKGLVRSGCAVLRFNFRGVGKSAGAFGDGVGEQEDFRAGLDFMAARYPDLPLWAGGMSFGAWVGLTVGAVDPRVSLLLGVAVPVNRYDLGEAARSPKPKFFVHGELDELCSEKQMREFYASAADPKELVIIESANHLFEGRASMVAEAVEDLLIDWPA
jgi:alpha/beta superfamily hydrolase